jgi:hypothetical protein
MIGDRQTGQHVGFGSLADVPLSKVDVCSYLKSGHSLARDVCPLRASK